MSLAEHELFTQPPQPPKVKTVAEVILEQLSAWGITYMYGVAGDAIIHLLDALNRQHKIQFFAVQHESAAAIMASAQGKCSSGIGVCLGTSGPGLVNMLNGIADAAADQIPMLVITGQVEQKKIGTAAKQYINQQQMIAPLAVYSTSVDHPDSIVDLVHQALTEATNKRGVAHLSIPKDILSAPCTQQIRSPLAKHKNMRVEELRHLDQAIMLLAAAKRPMLLIGEGARGAGTEVIQMAETLQAGIMESLGAKGVISFNSSYLLGGIGKGGTWEGQELFMEADCILVIGCNWWPEGFVPNQAQVIQIDRSPASIEGHPATTCGLVGDAAEVLRLLATRVKQTQEVYQVNRTAWAEQVLRTKRKIRQVTDQERASSTITCTPAQVMGVLDQALAADAIISVDTGDHTLWFNRIFRAQQQQVLYSGKWRTMGFGLPAAIAAKALYREKQVVALSGDGCFLMSMMELLTAVKYNISIIVIILNNGTLAMEKNKMKMEGLTPFAVDLYNPNYKQLAHSFGIQGFEVKEEKELLSSIQQAVALNQPVLIDVHVADVMPPCSKKHK